MIKDKHLEVDKEELKLIRREFGSGRFSVMKMFKDALIKNYTKHDPIIHINVWNDSFDVHVNKFKPAGSTVQVTEVYDGKRTRRSFTHKPIYVPDYARMKLFWATGLIHNLDSQIMNSVIDRTNYWAIAIHDAILALPGQAGELRQSYAVELKQVNINRYSILRDYRKSIGATTMKADLAFMQLFKAVVDAGDAEFSPQAMK